VLLDHDGGNDDFTALLVLLEYQARGLLAIEGIVVTPANCYILPAVSVTRKILRLYGQNSTETCKGVLDGEHPFPAEWRATADVIDQFPLLNADKAPLPPLSPEPGHEFLRRKLQEAEEPLTVVVTGPLTNLGEVLTSYPELSARIRRVVWMGGAFEVPGNVRTPDHDGSAEWNTYWDPRGAQQVFSAAEVPLVAFPCDVTDNVPVTGRFLGRLARQAEAQGQEEGRPAARLMGEIFAVAAGGKFDPDSDAAATYMWDTLPALSFGLGDRVAYATKRAEVLLGEPSAGRTRVVPRG
ncbi:unnamed protein product, partial [Heterosigma akashiwo]